MPTRMLDPIVRALVAVPEKHHGLILDVVNKLSGDDADGVRKHIANALREPIVPPPPEPPLDTIIRVDRSVRPVYPDFVKTVMHPELEKVGPAEYDLATVDLWLHDGQKDGKYVRGQVIYDHLKANNMLKSCLGFADGLAIKQKGVAAFRKVFGNNYVFLWRDVVRNRSGNLYVPYVYVFGGKVVVDWRWLDYNWDGDDPAARFAS